MPRLYASSPRLYDTTQTTRLESIAQSPAEQYAFPHEFQVETSGRSSLLKQRFENARYIGPFMQKYLLFESGSNLLVMDQHAAAERVTYEQLIKQMDAGNLEIQNLLSPVLVRVSPQEMIAWEESREEFEKVGLSSSQFDRDTIAIHTHPQLLKDTEKAVRYLLAGQKIQKSDHATLARRACRSSIMTGDKLAPSQAEFLREQLLQCQDPFTCPHGRPTVIEMTEGFLDKQFLRK
jgi:DNA mismatch repair protein MutL